MILKKYSDRIYYMPFNDKTDQPNIGYVLGDNFSVMIDTGNSPKSLNLFYKGLNERNLSKPDFALITHFHWDHTFAMCAFEGKTICNTITNNYLKSMSEWEWTDKAMKKRLQTGEEIEFCDTHMRIEYPNTKDIKVVPADITFDSKITLDLGGVNICMWLVGGPHSNDSSLVYVEEEKLIFCGDADSEDFYNNNGNYDKHKLTNYINYLDSLDFDMYIHGHVNPQTKSEILEILKGYLKKL